jgi:signal recognition particle subunit SRP54
MRSETGRPIKFIGVGEKLDGLAEFDAERIAGRILGMGDVVGLVERAMVDFDAASAEKMAAKMQSGKFDLNDMLDQFRQLQKMGGMAAMMDMLPGMGKIKQQMAGKVDENIMKRQEAMILSMTPAERREPDLIKASRKKRIAAGSGMRVEDVNKLLKSYEEMSKVMKHMKKVGIKGMLGGLMGKGGFGGGMEKMLGGINPADILPKDAGKGGANNLPPGLGLPPGFKLPKF